MMVSFKTNIADLTRQLDQFQRQQIPFAASRALNDVANAAKKQLAAELPNIFSKVTPFTARAVKIERYATKTDLRAVVTVQPIQAQYLQLEETGGVRTGAMNVRKPSTALTLPSVAAPLNAYGNLRSGALARLFALVQAGSPAVPSIGDKSHLRQLERTAAKTGSGPPVRKRGLRRNDLVYLRGNDPHNPRGIGGIFRRLDGHRLTRLIAFVASAQYRPRFFFRARVAAVAKMEFNAAFAKRLAEALRTARPG